MKLDAVRLELQLTMLVDPVQTAQPDTKKGKEPQHYCLAVCPVQYLHKRWVAGVYVSCGAGHHLNDISCPECRTMVAGEEEQWESRKFEDSSQLCWHELWRAIPVGRRSDPWAAIFQELMEQYLSANGSVDMPA